jgi:hypothetical protein
MQVVRTTSVVSGGRVSNTWAICLIDRDNAWKRVLIPDRLLNRMIREGKLLLQHDQMSPRRIS